MPNQIYKIDEAQLDNLKRRLLFSRLKTLAWGLLIMGVFQYFSRFRKDPKTFIIITLGIIPLLFLPVILSVNKLKRSYRSFEIILTEKGVEMKAEMMAYKYIAWNNLIIEETPNGTVNLYDKNISSFTRKMNGSGWIIIPPETKNIDILLDQLINHGR